MTADRLRKLHLGIAVAWMVIGLPVGWFITYEMAMPHAAYAILVVSLYANAVTHLSAYGAARAEETSNSNG
jgi:hypothetical protein